MPEPESCGQFLDIAAASEIPEGAMRGFDVGRERVLVARVDGRLCAVGGLCTHQIAHLEDGVLEDGRVLCPRHGAAFDLRTGEPTAPADTPIEVHEVEEVGGRVRVRLRPCPGS
jgi:nitrite reductase/ring-hydroxylating ferredoxin subunit